MGLYALQQQDLVLNIKIKGAVLATIITILPPSVILSDCTYLALNSDNGLLIQVDINGPKKPNSYGRDIFNLQIHQLNQSQCKYSERFGFFCQWCGACQHAGGPRNRNHFKGTCNSTNQTSCGGLIQYDSWQIKDDYPW